MAAAGKESREAIRVLRVLRLLQARAVARSRHGMPGLRSRIDRCAQRSLDLTILQMSWASSTSTAGRAAHCPSSSCGQAARSAARLRVRAAAAAAHEAALVVRRPRRCPWDHGSTPRQLHPQLRPRPAARLAVASEVSLTTTRIAAASTQSPASPQHHSWWRPGCFVPDTLAQALGSTATAPDHQHASSSSSAPLDPDQALMQRITGILVERDTPAGRVSIRAVSEPDVMGACVVLTRAFAGTPEEINLADARCARQQPGLFSGGAASQVGERGVGCPHVKLLSAGGTWTAWSATLRAACCLWPGSCRRVSGGPRAVTSGGGASAR